MLYRKVRIMALGAAILGMTACQPAAESQQAEAMGVEQFGEPVATEESISYDDLLLRLEEQDSLRAKVVGTVNEVCQAKGCWLTMGPSGGEGPEMMVKFKDYGFFVPKDIAGRQVVLAGKASWAITPVDELRHLARDAGKSEEEVQAITEPESRLQFLAEGVALLPEG